MKRYVIILFLVVTNAVLSQDSIRKNSIMVETNFIAMSSISYDRYIPFAEKASITLGAEYIMGTGFGWGAHWLVPEVGIAAFGPKHFLESSIQYGFDVSPYNEDDALYGRSDSFGARLAYRFQSKGGFNIRAVVNAYFSIDPVVLPAIGMGYSF